jgi:hypothetical protein
MDAPLLCSNGGAEHALPLNGHHGHPDPIAQSRPRDVSAPSVAARARQECAYTSMALRTTGTWSARTKLKFFIGQGAAMKPFALEPGMLTMRGVFYPTGHLFLLFPSERDARDAERAIERHGHNGEHISLLAPAEILEKIGRTAGADEPLPSPGTEADTVRRFAALARQGHHGLLIHAPSHEETERIMRALQGHPVSYGQKYRHLVIEDLVS